MTGARCRWCGKPAHYQCRAKGDPPIQFCDPESDCWERTYQTVRRTSERAWTPVGRTNPIPQPGPDLFDHLPDKGTTA